MSPTRFPSPPPHYGTQGAEPQNSSLAEQPTVYLSESTTPPNRHALTPYLTLPHLLSLTWLAYPILSLLFVAFQIVNSTGSAHDAVDDAKAALMTSCVAAQTAATAAASIPRYLAEGTNQQIINAVNASISASKATMIFGLTVVEAIVLFMIDTYRSTFLCFLELVIRGALAVLIGAVQTMSDFITSTLNGIRTSIQNDVATANNVIQTAVSGINKVTSLVHVNLNVPQFSIPSLDALNNVTLPTGFEDALLQLNSSLPTLDQLRDALDAVIEKPFDAVKADINNTFSAIQFNSSVLDVPAQNTLAFCSGMDLSVVDSLGRDIVKIARVAAALLVLAALLLIGVNCVIQWWRWRRLQMHLEDIRMAWRTDPTIIRVNPQAPDDVPEFEMTNHNLMLLINTAEHPLLSRIANHVTRVFGLSHSQHVNLRFFVSYVFYPPALACLLIGVLGILSVELQLAALGPLQKHYDAQVNSTVNNFSNQIALAINSGMTNQSATYATQVNTHMLDIQNQINDNVFGWVNTTTTALNDTIVAFYDELQNAVNSTLGGTVLASPAQEFLRCMIGTKIQSLEAALTFLHDNLQVNMPLVSNNILMLSNGTVDEVTKPISLAAVGGSSNSTSNSSSGSEQGIVGKVITRYIVSLKKQRILFAIFLGLWFFVVLIALLIICWHAYGFEVWEEHKRRRFQKEKDGFIVPWFHQGSGQGPLHPASLAAPLHHSTSVIAEAKERRVEGAPYGEEERSTTDENDLRSFTPLATPKRSIFSAVLSSSRGTNNGARYPTLQSLFAEDSNARADPKDLHPLSRTNPRFEQSWDSSLDARKTADAEKDALNKGSSATWNQAKLRNNARRLTKQDPFEYISPVTTPEPYDVPQTTENPWTSGWLRKALDGVAFWKAKESPESQSSRLQGHSSQDQNSPQNTVVPPVTYSSPTPQPFVLSAPPPPRARQDPVRRARDLPQSVRFTDEPGSPSTTVADTDPALPIHYHFVQQRERPQRVSNPFSPTSDSRQPPTPLAHHRFQPRRRLSTFPPPGLPTSRTLTPAVSNPFSTPFDDPNTPTQDSHRPNSARLTGRAL